MTTHSNDSHGERTSRSAQAREDARLVEETLAGNQLSFQLLVERYQERLFALARHYTKNPVEIEDVVQESFLKAFRRLDSFHRHLPVRGITDETALPIAWASECS